MVGFTVHRLISRGLQIPSNHSLTLKYFSLTLPVKVYDGCYELRVTSTDLQ